ncbi:XkdX family protein [Lactiplantibacillus plantarum]|nr:MULTISPECIES: XkdX family protein [Lactiplantibacillus]AYG28659.1 XkdX family protein [Lactiplantibacillus plantarum]MCB7140037.1 XkdX family protein [Lactiplantibacillus plantarum]MCB7156279.1 XkdX family protein [Lactiplantibacillus plantarum]MCB7165888.1 XkdX family protein [Lactiplantibacillus plantarum]MCB7166295.1 XkdX family protein [Lactiplantibacillus plantarum]
MFDFVKMMFEAGCRIEGYVGYGAITSDDYKTITGEDYVSPTTE